MVNERIIRELEFYCFYIIPSERAILAHARENGAHHRFLIGTDGGWVRKHHNEQWQELTGESAEMVRTKAESYYGKVPAHRIKRTLF